MAEPRRVADLMDLADLAAASGVAEVRSAQDAELAALVRRWIAAGGRVHERVDRNSVLRLVPEPVKDDGAGNADDEAVRVAALPRVHRLDVGGVRVVTRVPARTPHDVRVACREFIDTASIDGDSFAPQGRHRA